MKIPQKIMSRKDELTQQFLEVVEQHFEEVLKGRIDYLYHARHFGEVLHVHPVHLTNTIKLTTGQSICDIMENRVMTEAKRMLETTNMSIAEIGSTFGYAESTNFIKFFKNMCGETPLQYRKKLVSA